MRLHARFIEGSIPRHLVLMSLTGTVGLILTFLVDLIDVFFIAQLNQTAMTAGVGFAASLLFFVRSGGLALGIASGVLVSRRMGSGKIQAAKRFASHALLMTAVLVSLAIGLVYQQQEALLRFMGAQGEALHYAQQYLSIALFGCAFLAMGFCGNHTLRALGEGGQSMRVTVSAALTNALLDPIFIFYCAWDVRGAALATVISQMALFLFSWRTLIKRFQLFTLRYLSFFFADCRVVLRLAAPTVLSNLIAPCCAAFAARNMADFGDEAVAGFLVVMRLFPLSAAVVFALSGAVAPIVGQNAGAKKYQRVRHTLYHALWFNWLTASCMTLLLILMQDFLLQAFQLQGSAEALLALFCSACALLMGFDGMLFCSIASFNNLGKPFYATLCSAARLLLGAIPFVLLGKAYWGAKGVLLGFMAECLLVGCLAFIFALHLIQRYERQA